MSFPISIMTEITAKYELIGLPERKWMDESAAEWDTKTDECWFCTREDEDEDDSEDDSMVNDVDSDDDNG